ncbi:MAG: tRNA pseudouridine(55) synthase TruB [Bacteroidota bacterium]
MSKLLDFIPMSLNQLSCQEGAVIPINKPLGWTSFDVVKKLRSILCVKKIGHAGTLDPLATGLLVICTGKQTKAISHYQGLEKVYRGELVIGKTTPSVDLETDFDSEIAYTHVTEASLLHLAQSFTGYIDQIPPAYSAVKTKGVRAYTQARQGRPIALAPRKVFIRTFTITSINIPRVMFEVACGKGTYIRSLVRDFGEQLGTGAYLANLCRVCIGPYSLEEAYALADLIH